MTTSKESSKQPRAPLSIDGRLHTLQEAAEEYRSYLTKLKGCDDENSLVFKKHAVVVEMLNLINSSVPIPTEYLEEYLAEPTKKLTEKEKSALRLEIFYAKFLEHRDLLETRRDSGTRLFLKVVATIFTAGFAAMFGLWNVKGREITAKMEPALPKFARVPRQWREKFKTQFKTYNLSSMRGITAYKPALEDLLSRMTTDKQRQFFISHLGNICNALVCFGDITNNASFAEAMLKLKRFKESDLEKKLNTWKYYALYKKIELVNAKGVYKKNGKERRVKLDPVTSTEAHSTARDYFMEIFADTIKKEANFSEGMVITTAGNPYDIGEPLQVKLFEAYYPYVFRFELKDSKGAIPDIESLMEVVKIWENKAVKESLPERKPSEGHGNVTIESKNNISF